jgi:hypothetical protein
MSRFIDKLNEASRTTLQPMGFKAVPSAASKPGMLLVASLAEADVARPAEYVAGADAVLLPISMLTSKAKTIHKLSQLVPDIPWGGWLGDIYQKEAEQVVKSGGDFVVFPAADTSLAILQGEGVGRVLEVEASLSEGLLRAVNDLPVDAVLITSQHKKDYFLTWHHLMLFRCFADLLAKPLLVSIPSNVVADELQALWAAGVDGVVVKVGAEQPAGRLREVIDKLTLPSSRKRKAEAQLPYIGGEAEIEDEEE